MQPALTLVDDGFVAVSAPAPRRVNKFAIAGAAMVTAGALVAGPVTQSLPTEIQKIQEHAIALTALSPTDSPIEVYSKILSTTFGNVTALSQAVFADPLPLLSQVVRNQIGYGERIGGAIAGIPAGWQTYIDGRGATFFDNFKNAMAQGDTGAAVNYLSSFVLYGLQATITPIYNTILTYTPRGATEPIPGIPQVMAQNFANAVGAFFSPATFVSGIFQSGYGMVLSALAAAGEGIGGITQSLTSGDVGGAINALVNFPGLIVNAVLNGWQHPQSAAPFPALLTYIPVAPPIDPDAGQTRTGISIGLLGRLLVTIPKSIATSITPAAPSAEVVPVATTPTLTNAAAAIEPAPAVDGESVSTATESASAALVGASTTLTVDSDAVSDSASSGVGSAPGSLARRGAPASADRAAASQGDDAVAKDSGRVKKTAGSARDARGKASTSNSSDSSDSK